MQATKIAARPIPVAELERMGSLHPDGYSASTGQGVFTDNEVQQPKSKEEMGRVISFKFRNKCYEILDAPPSTEGAPETEE